MTILARNAMERAPPHCAIIAGEADQIIYAQCTGPRSIAFHPAQPTRRTTRTSIERGTTHDEVRHARRRMPWRCWRRPSSSAVRACLGVPVYPCGLSHPATVIGTCTRIPKMGFWFVAPLRRCWRRTSSIGAKGMLMGGGFSSTPDRAVQPSWDTNHSRAKSQQKGPRIFAARWRP